MKKGSITIFAAMSMMLVASFLFAMLESARYYGLQRYVKQKTPLLTESVFAEYNAKIWKDYHLLYLDGAYGGSEFSIEKVAGSVDLLAQKNLNYDLIYGILGLNDTFQMKLEAISVDSYELATDREGDAFLTQVASYMKQNLPAETAKIIYDRICEGEDYETEGEETEQTILDADTLLESAKESDDDIVIETEYLSQSQDTEENDEADASESENPIEFVLELKRNAVLGMVIENVDQVSKNTLLEEDLLLERECLVGNKTSEEESDWYAKLLLEMYLVEYFSNYTNLMENHALSYELEYIIAGKQGDRENLESIVGRLMLVREAANVVTLVTDKVKVEEAFALATLVAGFTGNPAIVKAVQIGIIGAWAYLESILDIKTLLQGGKIALLKSEKQWTTDVGNIIASFQSSAKAKECENGLTYQEFLLQFLFFTGTEEQTYRAMDVIEANLRLEPEYQNVRMDHMIAAADFTYQYGADSLFWDLITVKKRGDVSYQMIEKQSYSYILE